MADEVDNGDRLELFAPEDSETVQNCGNRNNITAAYKISPILSLVLTGSPLPWA